jgi:soluble lytic murein transglycosylase-like protein
MATSAIPVPLVEHAYYDRSDAAALLKKLTEIDAELGSRFDLAISHIAGLTNVPAELIKAIVFVESRGQWSVVSSAGAIGLMQLKPDLADATLYFETRPAKGSGKVRLSDAERAIVVEYIGAKGLSCLAACRNLGEIGKLPCFNGRGVVTADQLKKPELNLLLGSMAIRQYMDLHTEPDGRVRLDLVMARYGRGFFSLNKLPASAKASPAAFMAYIEGRKGWGEVSAAIKKLAGVNGLLYLQQA